MGVAARLSRFKPPSSRPSSSTFTRSYHQNGSHQQHDWSYNPVRILAPTVWSITAVSTIYFTCAAYDVYQDVRRYPKDRRRSIDFNQLEADGARRRPRRHDSLPDLSEGPVAAWNSLSGPQKVLAGVTATNTALLVLEKVSPEVFLNWVVTRLSHIPVQGSFRNSQLLTSAFVHAGPLHLFMNTFVLCNFAPPLARSPEFNNSGSHTLAFFLSGAIVSALGSHVSCLFWPNKAHRFRPGMGFSGVVSAVFAGWCMENPDARVRLFPFPFEFTGIGMLKASAMFETLGVLGLWSMLRLPLDVAFAAHLTGLAFGAAYVTYGSNGKFWKRSRRVAFSALKTTRVI